MKTIEEDLRKGHRKERNYRLISWLIYAIITAFVLYWLLRLQLISKLMKEFIGDDQYLEYMLPVSGIALLGYAIWQVMVLAKRPARITEVMERLNAGERPVAVESHYEWLLYLRLPRIIRLRLLPVLYADLKFTTGRKKYSLPVVNPTAVSSMELLINSGTP